MDMKKAQILAKFLLCLCIVIPTFIRSETPTQRHEQSLAMLQSLARNRTLFSAENYEAVLKKEFDVFFSYYFKNNLDKKTAEKTIETIMEDDNFSHLRNNIKHEIFNKLIEADFSVAELSNNGIKSFAPEITALVKLEMREHSENFHLQQLLSKNQEKNRSFSLRTLPSYKVGETIKIDENSKQIQIYPLEKIQGDSPWIKVEYSSSPNGERKPAFVSKHTLFFSLKKQPFQSKSYILNVNERQTENSHIRSPFSGRELDLKKDCELTEVKDWAESLEKERQRLFIANLAPREINAERETEANTPTNKLVRIDNPEDCIFNYQEDDGSLFYLPIYSSSHSRSQRSSIIPKEESEDAKKKGIQIVHFTKEGPQSFHIPANAPVKHYKAQGWGHIVEVPKGTLDTKNRLLNSKLSYRTSKDNVEKLTNATKVEEHQEAEDKTTVAQIIPEKISDQSKEASKKPVGIPIAHYGKEGTKTYYLPKDTAVSFRKADGWGYIIEIPKGTVDSNGKTLDETLVYKTSPVNISSFKNGKEKGQSLLTEEKDKSEGSHDRIKKFITIINNNNRNKREGTLDKRRFRLRPKDTCLQFNEDIKRAMKDLKLPETNEFFYFVKSIIFQESRYDDEAYLFEPRLVLEEHPKTKKPTWAWDDWLKYANEKSKVPDPQGPEWKKYSGSYGLFQLLPAEVYGEYGFQGSPEDLFDPYINIKYGMLQLAKEFKIATKEKRDQSTPEFAKYSKIELAAAAYNSGSLRLAKNKLYSHTNSGFAGEKKFYHEHVSALQKSYLNECGKVY